MEERKRTQTDRSAFGQIYADFIENELSDLRASKRSLERRGIAVVSTSGILVALLFGFFTVARHTDEIHIPHSARIWFYLALGALALAAVLAVCVNLPSRRQATITAALEAILRDRWSGSESIARHRTAITGLKLYAAYRQGNRRRGRRLTAAIASEVAGVMFLAVAIGLVVAHA